MLVKIICGTYGYRPDPDEPRVIRKDEASPAFELDEKEAERLIGLGVAKAYGTQEQKHDIKAKRQKKELASLTKEKKPQEDTLEDEDDVPEDEDDIFADDDEMPPELEAQEPM